MQGLVDEHIDVNRCANALVHSFQLLDMKRNRKVVNHMDVSVKKRTNTTNVQAYRITTSNRGYLATKRIDHLSMRTEEPISDFPNAKDEITQGLDVHDEASGIPTRRKLYTTKSKGRGSIHVSYS